MTIKLPRLCERRDDIPILVKHMLKDLADRRNEEPKEVSSEAMRILMAYQWHGNVRELRNEVQRLVLVSKKVIEHEDVVDLEVRSKDQCAHPDVYVGMTLEQIQREAIIAAVKQAGGNKALAARKLNIPRRTLYNRLKKYGIQ